MRHGVMLGLSLFLAGCGSLAGTTTASVAGQYEVLDATANATQNFFKVDDGLYRGGLPSESNLQDFVAKGIRTDISFLGSVPGDAALNAKEKKIAEGLGLRWLNFNVRFDQDPTASFVDNFLAALADPQNQPVYVHCLHGRDRTGMMVALYRMRHGHYTNQQALDEMKSFGFKPSHYPRFANFVLGFKLPVAP